MMNCASIVTVVRLTQTLECISDIRMFNANKNVVPAHVEGLKFKTAQNPDTVPLTSH
jgi:hypothetical protein